MFGRLVVLLGLVLQAGIWSHTALAQNANPLPASDPKNCPDLQGTFSCTELGPGGTHQRTYKKMTAADGKVSYALSVVYGDKTTRDFTLPVDGKDPENTFYSYACSSQHELVEQFELRLADGRLVEVDQSRISLEQDGNLARQTQRAEANYLPMRTDKEFVIPPIDQQPKRKSMTCKPVPSTALLSEVIAPARGASGKAVADGQTKSGMKAPDWVGQWATWPGTFGAPGAAASR